MSKTFKIQDGDISDGYHTFDELYEHRCWLFANLCLQNANKSCWKRDPNTPGWIILYLEGEPTGQISYHVPERFLSILSGKIQEDHHHEWDGHTSNDVLIRLKARAVRL